MAADLSTHHNPITGLFDWPSAYENWSQYRLAEDQIEFFQTHGYLAGVRVLDDEQIEALRGELRELIDPRIPATISSTNFTRTNQQIRRRCSFIRKGRIQIEGHIGTINITC